MPSPTDNSIHTPPARKPLPSTIRFLDYLEFVDFRNATEVEQCKHLLFFVTVIAGLRTNMTARIIEDRLRSLGLNIKSGRVQEILETHVAHLKPSVREPVVRGGTKEYKIADPLQPNEKAYELTKTTTQDMIDKANIRWKRARLHWWHKWDVPAVLWVAGAILFSVFVLGVWECATSGIRCLDFNVFKNHLNMSQLSPEQKATYFLYYITDYMKLIGHMTPEVISERMAETDIAKISAPEITSYFDTHSAEVIPSATRLGAYRLSETKSNEIKTSLTVKAPPEVTLKRVLENYPLTTIAGAVGLIVFIAGGSYVAGTITGFLSGRREKLVS